MELEELKQFLKVDGADLDIIIRGYQLAAEEYLKNTGVTAGYSNALYKIAVTIIVITFMENPGLLAGSGSPGSLNIPLTSLIEQLRTDRRESG